MNWYNINNSVKNALSISIDEEIGGWGINAKDFIEEVKNSGMKDIELTINSGGGSVIDAFAIYDFLKNSSYNVSVKIEGLCASAATVIALASTDKPTITENSFFMIHNPYMGVMVWDAMEADDLRDEADKLNRRAEVLDKMTNKIANIYVKATGLSVDKVKELMNNETWFTAEEALENGFVNSIEEAYAIAAYASTDTLAKNGYKNVPENYVNQLNKSNMSENKDSVLDQVKALLGMEVKAEAPKKEDAVDLEAIKAEILASIDVKASVELEEAKAKLVELEEANAKQVIEAKASAEALENSKKELEKASASREVIPAKEDNPSSKSNEIKDELGEHFLSVFAKSGLINKK